MRHTVSRGEAIASLDGKLLHRSPEELRREEESTSRLLSAARSRVDSAQEEELRAGRKINKLEKELNELQQEKLDIEKRQQETATLQDK